VSSDEPAKRWLEMKTPDLFASAAGTCELLLRLHAQPGPGQPQAARPQAPAYRSREDRCDQEGPHAKLALNVFRLVKALLKQAVLWQLLARNPADAVQAPRAKRFLAAHADA
jgi:hypothetical protein